MAEEGRGGEISEAFGLAECEIVSGEKDFGDWHSCVARAHLRKTGEGGRGNRKSMKSEGLKGKILHLLSDISLIFTTPNGELGHCVQRKPIQ